MENDRPPTPAFIRKEKAKFLAECQKKVSFLLYITLNFTVLLRITVLLVLTIGKKCNDSMFIFIYKVLKFYIFRW